VTDFLQLLLMGILVGGFYSQIAVGFVVIFKAGQTFNLAYGEMVMLGAYISWTAMVQWDLAKPVALLVTLVFAITLGLVVERLLLRRMTSAPIHTMIMLTLGLAGVLRGLVLVVWGPDPHAYPDIVPTGTVNLGDIMLPTNFIVSFFIAIAFVALLSLFFQYTKAGLSMRAASEDKVAAQSLGISVKRIYQLSWVTASIIAALGGILLAGISGVNLGLAFMGLMTLSVVILVGIDSILGALLAVILMGVATKMAEGYLERIESLKGIGEIFPMMLTLVVLLIRPHGLLGQKTVERV